MLGDKIKETLGKFITINDMHEEKEVKLAFKQLDQLLEDKEKNKDLEDAVAIMSDMFMGSREINEELKEKYIEKCQELEADHVASEEVIEDLTIDYNKICEDRDNFKSAFDTMSEKCEQLEKENKLLHLELGNVLDERVEEKKDIEAIEAIKYALNYGYSDFDSDEFDVIYIHDEECMNEFQPIIEWHKQQLEKEDPND